MSHTIAFNEIRDMNIEHLIARSVGHGDNKALVLRYDIGRKSLYWVVIDRKKEYDFDTVEEAIEAYNEV